MSLKYGILGLLNYEPQTGYDVNTFFNESLAFFWSAQISQIYRELNKLEADGLARSEVVVQYDKPNKKIYHITEEGKKEFLKWLLEGGSQETLIRSSFLMRVFFSAEQGRENTIQMLDKFKEDMKAVLETMEPIKNYISSSPHSDQSKLYWDISADFGYRYYKMCVEWAENAITQLKG